MGRQAMDEIAIVGAGIGGLTAALALRQRGMDPVVYEGAPELEEVGAGIWMPPNAMEVLRRLGVAEAVEERGRTVHRVEVRGRWGDLLKSIQLAAHVENAADPTVAIHRGRLQAVLAEAIPRGRLVTDHRCVGVQPTDAGIRLLLEGKPPRDAKILIGADGLHSRVRAYVDPEARVRDTGQVAVRGIAPMALPRHLQGTSRELWGGPIRFGFSEIGRDETYWWCACEHRALEGAEPDGLRAHVVSLASGFPPPVSRLVSRTPAHGLLRTPLQDLEPVGRWWRGRVALLGDAAHAMTPNLGQGGAQAIEDAFVLAKALSTEKSTEEAFRSYERTRRTRAETVARMSRWTGALAHASHPAARWMRDTALRLTPRWVDDRQARALYRPAS